MSADEATTFKHNFAGAAGGSDVEISGWEAGTYLGFEARNLWPQTRQRVEACSARAWGAAIQDVGFQGCLRQPGNGPRWIRHLFCR